MKYNDNGEYKDIYIKTFDTLPVGTEVDYDGETVPEGWSEITEGYTLLDNSIYYKKVGKMVTLFRPARTTSGSYIQNEIALSEFNYTNLNASNKLLPSDLRPNARIGFTVFAHTTGNENLTRCYGEIMETGYIAIYNWGSATTLNRLAFCVTYMVD